MTSEESRKDHIRNEQETSEYNYTQHMRTEQKILIGIGYRAEQNRNGIENVIIIEKIRIEQNNVEQKTIGDSIKGDRYKRVEQKR